MRKRWLVDVTDDGAHLLDDAVAGQRAGHPPASAFHFRRNSPEELKKGLKPWLQELVHPRG